MSIFLLFIFFKSICLFLQNLVLRVHVRLFGANSANLYYSTAYHYLNGGSAVGEHFCPAAAAAAAHQPSSQHRGSVAHYRRRRYHRPKLVDDPYQLKLNNSRSIIRQQQQIHLQSLRRIDSESSQGPPQSH